MNLVKELPNKLDDQKKILDTLRPIKPELMKK